jgi:glycosyltransferase involved in cell wall biosynthesis
MKTSFIIICKNAEKHIGRCVESILSLGLSNSEIIAIDGQSEDNTKQILSEKQINKIINQNGKGIGNARNLGLQSSIGNLICYLDSDDCYEKNNFLKLHNSLISKKKLMGIGGHLVKSNDPTAPPFQAYTPGGFIFRREIFEKIGYFREDLEVAADHEWFIRFIRNEKSYEISMDVILKKEIHQDSLSIVKQKKYRDEIMMLLKQKTS